MKFSIISLFILSTIAGLVQSEPVKWTRKVCRLGNDIKLSQKQKKVICDAAIYYDIDLLEKDDKQIILIREHSHFRDERSTTLGKKIVDEFSFRGIENLTWENKGGLFRMFKWGGDQLTSGSTVKDAIQEGFYFHVHNEIEQIYLDGIDITKTIMTDHGPSLSGSHWVSNAILMVQPDENITLHLERDPKVNEALNENCTDGLGSCDDLYLVHMRDQSMVNGIMSGLEWFPEKEQMLAITGHAHGEGMLRKLNCDHGFKIHKISRGASCLNAEYPGHYEAIEVPSCE